MDYNKNNFLMKMLADKRNNGRSNEVERGRATSADYAAGFTDGYNASMKAHNPLDMRRDMRDMRDMRSSRDMYGHNDFDDRDFYDGGNMLRLTKTEMADWRKRLQNADGTNGLTFQWSR